VTSFAIGAAALRKTALRRATRRNKLFGFSGAAIPSSMFCHGNIQTVQVFT
jgi:hypothetical protein